MGQALGDLRARGSASCADLPDGDSGGQIAYPRGLLQLCTRAQCGDNARHRCIARAYGINRSSDLVGGHMYPTAGVEYDDAIGSEGEEHWFAVA